MGPETSELVLNAGDMSGMSHRKQGGETGTRNICLTLAFDGSQYHGWQIQRNQPTIQAVVSEAIRKITGETVSLVGSGRTDAGTHARTFFANFVTAARLSPASLAAFSGRAVKDTVRWVYRSDLKKVGHRLLYTAEAEGFLHHMVRNMVGTLLELGRGRMNLDQLGNLFASRNRDLAGFTVPAH